MVVDSRITLEEIDRKTVELFVKLASDRLPHLIEETDLKTILQKINLYEGNQLKRAALILFGSNPQKYYPQTILKIGKFLDEAELVSTELIDGNLFQQTQKAIEILENKYLIKEIEYDGIHRRELLEYPYDALREAI